MIIVQKTDVRDSRQIHDELSFGGVASKNAWICSKYSMLD